jgi:hypothetical protein
VAQDQLPRSLGLSWRNVFGDDPIRIGRSFGLFAGIGPVVRVGGCRSPCPYLAINELQAAFRDGGKTISH